MDKYKIEKNTVQETLIIPLYGRRLCSRIFPTLFQDESAAELMERIDYDFSKLDKESNSLMQVFGALEVAMRQSDLAWEVRDYLKSHPNAAVINLGCGLDNTSRACDNGSCKIYNIDLSDVIELRNRLLPAEARERNLALDLNDPAWLDAIDTDPVNGTVLFAAGVFYYKTITLSVLAFILITGCVLLYLNPGDHQLMMDLLLFLIVGPAVISPLMELVEFGAELRNLSVRMDQIDDVLKMEPTGEGQIDAVPACPALSFRDVSFSYQKAADPLRRMALDHVNMELPAGSFVALVAPSGGGKSTAGQLLARFWDVESGSIAIGGTDIRDYTARALMDAVAFVFQDTYIFAESAYDNIAMHREVSWEAVEQAAKAARCHEFILSLPDGYNTRLGDGGHKLSGGEAQRIAIARAILKDAPIVVLDEAMAFADAENELALREGMAELLRGKTVLMIAHRLYSIRDADCIYILDSGRLVESGTHPELLDQNGLYAHLWAVQNETEDWQMKGGVSHA